MVVGSGDCECVNVWMNGSKQMNESYLIVEVVIEMNGEKNVWTNERMKERK